MWIGSKVPPKIPILTAPRIGRRGRHQTQSPRDVSGTTAQESNRIYVAATDPDRQVNRFEAVSQPGRPDPLAPEDSCTVTDRNL